jgi:hypothetical protein
VVPDWLRVEVVTGLQKLMVLRLPGSPAADTATATAEVWLQAIDVHGAQWNESIDSQRVHDTFLQMLYTCDRWPVPKQFFEQLRPRVLMNKSLTVKMSAEERKENRRRIKEIVGKFNQQHKM